MRAHITRQPACGVARVEPLAGETIFHLTTGESLRVGLGPSMLAARLEIDLSKPPDSIPCDIFCHPFMALSLWKTVIPLLRSHPEVQKALVNHSKLQALLEYDYEELRKLPLLAYTTRGLYLSHPFNLVSRSISPEQKSTEYWCDFQDGDYLVKVVAELSTHAITVTK